MNKYQITNNKYQITKLIYILFVLCSLLFVICFVSCDLFTGSKVDLYKAISDEVDWANAPKLSVRIEFPAAWGVSSPAQGGITPAMDIRMGYEFKVEFTPDNQYALQSWMVFRTERLNQISFPASWVENPEIILDPKIIQPLGPDEVTLRDFNASDKVFYFTVYTADPVTLVPCCDTEPRITRTEPRHRPDGPPYSRASDVVLYFNGALDAGSVRFAESETDDGIWITAEDDDNNVTKNKDEEWYAKLKYSAVGGFFTVTLETGAKLPPPESLMTVTVRGIKNAQGNSMASGYSFSWRTSSAVDVDLTSYAAAYNNNGSITVSWTESGADKVETYYRLNSGINNPLDNADNKAVITGVGKPDDSGVREGRQVTGIEEYEIFIELYVDEVMESRTSFKIWNFPGMSTSDTNPLTEVKTAEQLAAMKANDSTVKYVLANDIEVNNVWTPIGSDGNSFKGKFYGNGHTITFTGSSSIGGTTNYRGLFGYADGALIRDFTFEYNAPAMSVNVLSDFYIGCVAGYFNDTTVRNVITSSGTFDINATDGYDDIRLGGIAGFIEGSGKIENCRVELSTKYATKGHHGEVFIGAIAGETGTCNDVNNTIVTNLGTVANPEWVELNGLLIDGVTVAADVSADVHEPYQNNLYIGGAVGKSGQNTMNDITFKDKTVLFSGRDYVYCGGLVGLFGQTNIVDSSFAGNIIEADNGNILHINLGGLIGYVNFNNDSGSCFINRCQVRRVNIELNSASSIYVGGYLGNSQIFNGTITITNCFFEDGEINVKDSYYANAGGFCGRFEVDGGQKGIYNIKNCGTLSGTITVNNSNTFNDSSTQISVGGFTSTFNGNISNCTSGIDIITTGACNQFVGGFCSSLNNGTISACYATGTVSSVVLEGDYQVFIGGLAGNNRGTIKNSYALGNVLVNKISSGTQWVIAGGLIGFNDGGTITNCFSAGQVSAQSVTSKVYSGGIVGRRNGGSITYTAALGASVTVKGDDGMRFPGRIYGDKEPIANINDDNYALNTMVIEDDAYNKPNPSTRPAVSDAAGLDGEDVASAVFFTQAFWKTKVNFTSANWDFSRVGKDGHPRLLNVGGQ